MTSAIRTIGHSKPCFIIAEAGVNHNGDLALAHRLIDVAADAKADAVKFQTFRADALVSPKASKAAYQQETTGGGNQMEMLRALELEASAWRELQTHARERSIRFMSTPFDEASCDLLSDMGVDLLKLGSGDLTNKPLVEHCALTGLPLIMSTGMANRAECEAAVSWFRLAFRHGDIPQRQTGVAFEDGGRLAMLHCVSAYPAPDDALNLRAMGAMREFLGLPIGFSDHSTGVEASVMAVAAGACIIEKHFTTDSSLPGPDHRASLEPDALATLVSEIRRIERMLGHGRKEPAGVEENVRSVARRSVVALRDIPKGARISAEDVGIRRPASGVHPSQLHLVVGSRALVEISAGDPVTKSMIEFTSSEELAPQRPKH